MALNPDTKYKINLKRENTDIYFLAFLENNDILYNLNDETLPFTSTNLSNNKIATRVLQKVKLSFNVVGENKKESIDNFKNLLSLIEILKPKYYYINNQYLPMDIKLSKITLKFDPFIINEIDLQTTNFTYRFDKEFGLIQVSKKELDIDKANDYKLIPIAFNLNIEGNILLSKDKVALGLQ